MRYCFKKCSKKYPSNKYDQSRSTLQLKFCAEPPPTFWANHCPFYNYRSVIYRRDTIKYHIWPSTPYAKVTKTQENITHKRANSNLIKNWCQDGYLLPGQCWKIMRKSLSRKNCDISTITIKNIITDHYYKATLASGQYILPRTWSIRERSGSVVECLTRNRGAASSSLTSVTALCPWARHIYPSLVLVQPRRTRPYITERLLMGRKESNQTNQNTKSLA